MFPLGFSNEMTCCWMSGGNSSHHTIGWMNLFPTSICCQLQVWKHYSTPHNQVCWELVPYRMLVLCTWSWRWCESPWGIVWAVGLFWCRFDFVPLSTPCQWGPWGFAPMKCQYKHIATILLAFWKAFEACWFTVWVEELSDGIRNGSRMPLHWQWTQGFAVEHCGNVMSCFWCTGEESWVVCPTHL